MKFFHLYDKAPSPRHGWPYVYFHGALENYLAEHAHVPPDLVAGDTSPDTVADGIYEVTVYDQPARLFFWSCGERDFVRMITPLHIIEQGRKPYRTGLIVFPSDQDAMQYAQRVFTAKQEHL